MNANKISIEIQGETVEEAIEQGLAELNLTRKEVNVDIIDPGSRGLFGLGSREAHVRITYIKPDKNQPQIQEESSDPVLEKPKPPVETAAIETQDETPTSATLDTSTPAIEDSDNTVQIVEETIRDLLDKMYIKAQVSAKLQESDTKRQNIWVDINGDDLNVLIGRRSETVNALQYITKLIVGKELGRSVHLTIDVAGYRTRRENQLRSLARRMARQAEETGKTQFLEPMPANERRIIHIELRNHPNVITQSMGEGNRRKVTILLKS